MADGTPVYSAQICEHRMRLGLTQREVAEELAKLAYERDGDQARRGINAAMVSRWERGVKRPSPYYQALLCLLFGATPAQLGFRLALPAESSGRDGGRYDGPVDNSRSAREEEDVKRRRFLGVLSAAALAPLDHQLEGMRRGFDAALSREPLTANVEEWERTAYAYSCETVTVAPRELLPNLLADFDELRELLEHCPASARRQLTFVAGQLAALIAVTMAGLGQQQAARRWWRSARTAADQAGEPRLASFVRGRQAVLALYGAYEPSHVLDLAEEAVSAGHGIPCAGVVSGMAARAQALGGMGRADLAHAALADLERMFDRLPDDVTRERASFFAYAEQRLRHTESYVYTRLGETRGAEAAQDAALALYPASSIRGAAQVRLHRAACLIKDGDVGEGARYATGVLDGLPEGHHSVLMQRVAHDALSAVPPSARTLPAVAEYRDRLAVLAA